MLCGYLLICARKNPHSCVQHIKQCSTMACCGSEAFGKASVDEEAFSKADVPRRGVILMGDLNM